MPKPEFAFLVLFFGFKTFREWGMRGRRGSFLFDCGFSGYKMKQRAVVRREIDQKCKTAQQ